MIDLLNNLNMNPSLVEALRKEDITTPTEIQRRVIPEVLKNKDLIVQSETGTGKTLAYLLPLFEKIDTSKKEMQTIILAPTHELAIQILRQVELLSQNSGIKVSSVLVIGNVNVERQVERLREKPHIIVGSLTRILELIKKRKISAHTIKTIIIDEADSLMDDNNIGKLKEVIKSTLKERQLMLFSASITKKTEARAKEIMKKPEFIKEEGIASVPASIDHMYFITEQRDKLEVLRKVIGILNPSKALVFIGHREETDVCKDRLSHYGLKVEGIHGQSEKMDRKRIIDEFKSGKIHILVASDIASRGLHIEGITHVFNLNIPEKYRDYLHRVGRTGRKGNSGIAISIVTERELLFINMFEKALKIKIAAKDMYRGTIIDAKKK